MQNLFLIIGGDLRQQHLYTSLISSGCKVDMIFNDKNEDTNSAFEKISKANVIILPVPSSHDKIHLFAPLTDIKIKLEDITSRISPEAVLFIGGENPIFTACKTKKTVNLLADEVMTLKNAMATAEAALSILINKTDTTIKNSNILILGFGRIARILAEYLKSLNANVTVCARKDTAQTLANLNGLNAIGFDRLLNKLKSSDIIINTVPSLVLGEKELLEVSRDSLILDLASKPGGVDFSFADSLGLKAIQALSLPGKYSPKSAAKYIEECIFNTLV